MGISCKNGKLTITDNDNISLSNLNRQFLFHKNDVKENSSKSFCAKREALKINKDMKIQNYQFISAVYNLSARKYIDYLSTFFNKIFSVYLNSGTEGTKLIVMIYFILIKVFV